MYKTILILLSFLLHFHALSSNSCRYAFLHLQEDTIKQLLLAEHTLNKSLSDPQIQAIINAHNIGTGEPGKNGASAGIGNYTKAQLLRKARILKQFDFTQEEIRTLMENEIVGIKASSNETLSGEPARFSTSDMAMAEMGLKLLNEKFSEIRNEEFLKRKEIEIETREKIDEILFQMSPEEIVAILLYYNFRFDLIDKSIDRNNALSWEISTFALIHNHLFLNPHKPVSEELLLILLPYMLLLPKEQVKAIPPEMITKIPADRMKEVSPFALYFMTPEQVQAVTPEQIKKINPENIRYFITSKRIEIMTLEQLQAVTSEQKQAMPLELIEMIRDKEWEEKFDKITTTQ